MDSVERAHDVDELRRIWPSELLPAAYALAIRPVPKWRDVLFFFISTKFLPVVLIPLYWNRIRRRDAIAGAALITAIAAINPEIVLRITLSCKSAFGWRGSSVETSSGLAAGISAAGRYRRAARR